MKGKLQTRSSRWFLHEKSMEYMYKREAVPRRCGRIFYCDGKQCFVPQDSPAARPTCVLIFSRVPCCRAKADSPATAVCLSWGNPNSLRRSCLVFQRRGRKEDGEERVGFPYPQRRRYLHIFFWTPSVFLSVLERWLNLWKKQLHRTPINVGFLSSGTQKRQSYRTPRGTLEYKSMAIYPNIIEHHSFDTFIISHESCQLWKMLSSLNHRRKELALLHYTWVIL